MDENIKKIIDEHTKFLLGQSQAEVSTTQEVIEVVEEIPVIQEVVEVIEKVPAKKKKTK